MRTPLVAACCVALLVVRVLGQGKPEDVDPSLREAIAAWAAAIATGDEGSISRYALDDAVFVSPSGVALTKLERLDMLRNTGARGATPPSSAHRYQIFGNTVVHTYRQDGMNPQGVIVPTRQLQVWVKQDTGWRVATSQATYVAER
jgi:ketosteroid isomerase-like protein